MDSEKLLFEQIEHLDWDIIESFKKILRYFRKDPEQEKEYLNFLAVDKFTFASAALLPLCEDKMFSIHSIRNGEKHGISHCRMIVRLSKKKIEITPIHKE